MATYINAETSDGEFKVALEVSHPKYQKRTLLVSQFVKDWNSRYEDVVAYINSLDFAGESTPDLMYTNMRELGWTIEEINTETTVTIP